MQLSSFAVATAISLGRQFKIELRIITIAMEFDTMLFDPIYQVGCIHGKKSLTKHRPLWDRTDYPDCSRGDARVRNSI